MKVIHTEYLPTNQASCHAASITIFNGHPVFSWFEGTREGRPDVYIKVFNQDGKFSESFIGKDDSIPRWNPILFQIKDQLFLFEKIGVFCDRWNTIIHNLSNSNGDKKDIQILPAGVNASVKTKPLLINDKMYCGSSVETLINWSSYIEEFSIDNAKKIEMTARTKPLSVSSIPFKDIDGRTHKSKGIIQPSLWHDGTNLNAFFRASYGLEAIYYARTEGTSMDKWTRPVPTNFPNPNSSIDTVYLNGRLFLIFNMSTTSRSPLVLTELDKEHRPIANLILEEASLTCREFSYPYMIEHEGKLHIVYTYDRKAIKYIVVEV